MRSIKNIIVANIMYISNDIWSLVFIEYDGYHNERNQLARRVRESVRTSVRNNIKP